MEKRNNIKVSDTGYYNCHKRKHGEEVKNMPLLSEDDAIKFVHVSKDPIADLEPSSVSEKDGEKRFIYKFKIGKFANWFTQIDGTIQKTTKPTNQELEGCRAECFIICSFMPKTPGNPLAPSGYWVNDICYKLVPQNPFEGCSFDNTNSGECLAPSASDNAENEVEEVKTETPQADPIEKDLPF